MRYLLFALIAIVGLVEVGSTQAATWTIAPPGTARSKEIHELNIMERPSRPLHIYGDAVRLAHRRSSRL